MKYICKDCAKPCEIIVDSGSDAPFCCPYDPEVTPDWQEVDETLQPDLQDKQKSIQDSVAKFCYAMDKGKENVAKATCNFGNLPKLTAEVFDRPDCPEWAQYAAVDKDGDGFFYKEKPRVSEADGEWLVDKCITGLNLIIGDDFDPTDWQKSLIERHAKLPEWCKQGEWIYDHHQHGYEKIIAIEDGSLYCIKTKKNGFFTVDYATANFVPARLRPYNTEEVPKLPFEVSEINSDFRTIVVSCKGDKVWLGGASIAISTEELMRDFTIDNTPCGILEHLENGKWIE